jgi:hypothetical protein
MSPIGFKVLNQCADRGHIFWQEDRDIRTRSASVTPGA